MSPGQAAADRPAWRVALPFAALLFLLVGAHGLLETARDSLFLRSQPVSHLPWVYLAVTLAVLVVTPVQTWLWGRQTGSRALSFTLLGASVLTAVFWAISRGAMAVNAFYVWTALFSSLIFAQFWLTADEAFDAAQARRLFGFIGAGGLMGGVGGTVVARLTLTLAPPRMLLLVSGGLTLIAAAMAWRWRCGSHATSKPEVAVLRSVPRDARSDPYLRWLTLLALVPALAATLVDFIFKASIAEHVARDRIPLVVANAYVAQAVLALIVELVLVRTILGSAGVTRSLLLLPVLLFAAAAGFAVVGSLALAMGLKILDGGLRPSLHRVSNELLYVPVSPAKRRVLKPSIDTFGQRGGQTVASVLLLVLQNLQSAPALVAAALAAAALGWLQVVRALRARYLQLFREQLSDGRIRAVWPSTLDLRAAEPLVAALGSSDPRQVILAMDLLAQHGRLRMIPALILYHPDPQVVRAALSRFADTPRDDVDALLPFLLSNPDPGVRAAGVGRWAMAGKPPEGLTPLTEDSSPLVRAAALVALSRAPSGAEAMAKVQTIARAGSLEERRALARAIAEAPRPDLQDTLETLFRAPDIEIRREVIRSTQRLPSPLFVPGLILMLAEPQLRGVARGALAAIGQPALDALAAQMRSERTPYQVAREIPTTVARFAPEQAAPPLLERLTLARGGLDRFRALRALNQLRRQNPTLPLSREALEKGLSIELSTVFKDRALRLATQHFAANDVDGPTAPLLLELLRGKEALAIERVFRNLQLLFPMEQVEHVYLGLRSQRSGLRAAAQELLLELLEAPWREPLQAVAEPDAPGPEPHRAPWSAAQLQHPEAFLEALLGHASEIVSVLGAHLASERGWAEALPKLRALSASLHGESATLVSAAISRLEQKEQRGHG
jgi:AAA family ATP:ADP antiporter